MKKMTEMILFCLWSLLYGVFGIEFVSVMEGDRVIMNLNETQRNDGIKWRFGPTEIVVAEIIEGVKSIYDERADGRFRDRLQLNKDTGSLTITNISITHTGLYQITSSKTQRQINAFNITVYARLPVPVIISNNSSSSSSCVFVCSVMDVSHVTLSWYKGNSLLSNISVSDLSISLSLSLECLDDSYSCVINNSISSQTHHLTSDDCRPCAEKIYCWCDTTEAVIRLAVSAFVGVAVVAVVVYDIRSRRDEQKMMTSETELND